MTGRLQLSAVQGVHEGLLGTKGFHRPYGGGLASVLVIKITECTPPPLPDVVFYLINLFPNIFIVLKNPIKLLPWGPTREVSDPPNTRENKYLLFCFLPTSSVGEYKVLATPLTNLLSLPTRRQVGLQKSNEAAPLSWRFPKHTNPWVYDCGLGR